MVHILVKGERGGERQRACFLVSTIPYCGHLGWHYGKNRGEGRHIMHHMYVPLTPPICISPHNVDGLIARGDYLLFSRSGERNFRAQNDAIGGCATYIIPGSVFERQRQGKGTSATQREKKEILLIRGGEKSFLESCFASPVLLRGAAQPNIHGICLCAKYACSCNTDKQKRSRRKVKEKNRISLR